MNLFFQYIEFGNSSNEWLSLMTTIIASLLGALISGLIAIWIFKQGIKKQKKFDQSKEINRLLAIKKFYLHTVESNLEPLENQIKSNIKLINVIKRKVASNFSYRMITSLNFEDLKNIDQKDLFNIFLNQQIDESKVENFRKIKNSIRIIESITDLAMDMVKYIDSKYQNYQDQFAIYIDKIQRIIEKETHILDEQNVDIVTDQFLYSLWQVALNWHNITNVDNRDPYIVNEQYLIPMRDVCARFHTDHRKPELLNLIINAQHNFEQIDNVKNIYRGSLINDTRELIKANNNIKYVLEELNEK